MRAHPTGDWKECSLTNLRFSIVARMFHWDRPRAGHCGMCRAGEPDARVIRYPKKASDDRLLPGRISRPTSLQCSETGWSPALPRIAAVGSYETLFANYRSFR